MSDLPGLHRPSEEERAEFEERYARASEREAVVPTEKVDGQPVIWRAQKGSQVLFISSRHFETLYHGTRGPGKTDALIMAFAVNVGKYGAAWRGIIFRQTYPQLADVQAKTEKWFRLAFGNRAKFNRAKMMWEWDTGEVLMLRHLSRPADYWNYHGHNYPFIGFEELCNWSDPDVYTQMFACCRTSTKGVPLMVRATANPYGPGHNWVMDRFQLHGRWWEYIVIPKPKSLTGMRERPRSAIHGHIDENLILLDADPHYKETIVTAAANQAMAEAWLDGSWDIVAGGMFDDVWKPEYNVVSRFKIPFSWRIDRSFDWGSSAPFSVGWWAESDGSDLQMPDGSWRSTVRGDIFRVEEWYGWTGKPNQGTQLLAEEIAKGIVEREIAWGWRDHSGSRVKPGPADNSIHKTENGNCIARDMTKPVRIGNQMYSGLTWARADKSPGSRVAGWEQMRRMMKSAHPNKGLPREKPGLFVVGERCPQFLRTVPTLPRDERNMDDVDSKAEDHIGDETRYRVRTVGVRVVEGHHTGMY